MCNSGHRRRKWEEGGEGGAQRAITPNLLARGAEPPSPQSQVNSVKEAIIGVNDWSLTDVLSCAPLLYSLSCLSRLLHINRARDMLLRACAIDGHLLLCKYSCTITNIQTYRLSDQLPLNKQLWCLPLMIQCILIYLNPSGLSVTKGVQINEK